MRLQLSPPPPMNLQGAGGQPLGCPGPPPASPQATREGPTLGPTLSAVRARPSPSAGTRTGAVCHLLGGSPFGKRPHQSTEQRKDPGH